MISVLYCKDPKGFMCKTIIIGFNIVLKRITSSHPQAMNKYYFLLSKTVSKDNTMFLCL